MALALRYALLRPQKRVQIAAVSDVPILAEPTDHLDMHAVEALERFLAGFAGVLVLVSHDRHLVEAVSSAVWRTESLPSEGAKLLLS